MPKGGSADLSTENSGEEQRMSRKSTPGRPFAKGVSGNPGGRPATAAAFRQLTRAAAAAFLDQLVALARAGKLDFGQLMSALHDSATRGGCLTDEKIAELDTLRLRTLADVLAGAHLTEQHRTNILEDYQARLRAQTEAP